MLSEGRDVRPIVVATYDCASCITQNASKGLAPRRKGVYHATLPGLSGL
jgi:hypothetical protein